MFLSISYIVCALLLVRRKIENTSGHDTCRFVAYVVVCVPGTTILITCLARRYTTVSPCDTSNALRIPLRWVAAFAVGTCFATTSYDIYFRTQVGASVFVHAGTSLVREDIKKPHASAAIFTNTYHEQIRPSTKREQLEGSQPVSASRIKASLRATPSIIWMPASSLLAGTIAERGGVTYPWHASGRISTPRALTPSTLPVDLLLHYS